MNSLTLISDDLPATLIIWMADFLGISVFQASKLCVGNSFRKILITMFSAAPISLMMFEFTRHVAIKEIFFMGAPFGDS